MRILVPCEQHTNACQRNNTKNHREDPAGTVQTSVHINGESLFILSRILISVLRFLRPAAEVH